MIIAVLNEKGGVGKTTLVTNLARAYQRQQLRVLMVDSDPQGSLRDWLATAGDDSQYPSMVAMDKPSMIKDLKRMGADYDVVLVDGCPKAMGMIATTVTVADLVLIPVQPSGFDLWAANSVVELIRQRREVTDGIPQAAFVVTRQINNTKLQAESRTALADLGLPILSAFTTQRIAYAAAASGGKTVLDAAFAGTVAAHEITALAAEVWKLVDHDGELANARR
jgi:chromosome partitioning protein